VGLTNGSFIITLFAAALTAGALTVRLWPRYARPGTRHVLSRIGLLTLTQVVALLAVLVYLNAYFEFYSGWDDLLGTNAGTAAIKRGQIGGTRSTPPAAPMAISALGPRRDRRALARDGLIEKFRFTGQTTGLSAEAYVVLPREYFQPAYATRRFPVSLVLTGYPGNPYSLIRVMHLPSLIRQGELAGTVQPTVYVLMRPTLVPPRDTECTDVPDGPQVESFFAIDVPAAVDARYRVVTSRAGWGIMGDSTGGYCAAKIAMRHSDRFAAAVSLSGYFHSLQDLTTGDLYGGSRSVRDENDLLWRQWHLPAPPISLLVTSCKTGEKSYPQAERFLRQVRAPMRADSLILDSGGHNFRTFRRMMPASLEWMSAHLKAE
jgi:Putative esterase